MSVVLIFAAMLMLWITWKLTLEHLRHFFWDKHLGNLFQPYLCANVPRSLCCLSFHLVGGTFLVMVIFAKVTLQHCFWSSLKSDAHLAWVFHTFAHSAGTIVWDKLVDFMTMCPIHPSLSCCTCALFTTKRVLTGIGCLCCGWCLCRGLSLEGISKCFMWLVFLVS